MICTLIQPISKQITNHYFAMKKGTLLLFMIFIPAVLWAQAQVPEATEIYVDLEKVTPGVGNLPPSDAIVLF
jgi:hypothetical protein